MNEEEQDVFEPIKLRLAEPEERRTHQVTWVRTTEICAEVDLEPGVTADELVAAIEAGMFCGGEVIDPDTADCIANVLSLDEEFVEDSGVVVE